MADLQVWCTKCGHGPCFVRKDAGNMPGIPPELVCARCGETFAVTTSNTRTFVAAKDRPRADG